MNEYGCRDSATVEVNVWKKPVAEAGSDKSTKEGVAVQLNGSIKGTDVYYFWSPPNYLDDANSLNPFANPPQSVSFNLQVTSNLGCGTSIDAVLVKVYPQVIIPNAFSPNGDGINDTWNVKALHVYDQSETFIYNRYGQLVYHSKGYLTPWDGKRNGSPLPVGMYYYVIDLKVNNEPKLTGSVLIIR
jgi:gliding motility-associated-like protein